MMDGWIKLHRCLIDKAIWKRSQPEQKAVLVTILCIANHEPNEWIWDGKKYIVESGQFITSLESLAKKSGVSIRSVRTALANFEKLEFLTSKSTKTGRLITVVNWALYQHQENKSTNKSTNDRQTTDKEPTTNKNDKNDKNDKNELKEIYIAVVAYLNEKTGAKFKPVESNIKFIRARVNDGYTLEDFKTVVDKKVAEWIGTDQQKYLRPETLFGNKFDGYLNQSGGKHERILPRPTERPGSGSAKDSKGKIPDGFWA